MTRPTWTETWADLARAIARRSRCDRAQIGAVIVDAQNRVLATAYNGPPANWWPANAYRDELGGIETTCRAWCTRCENGPTPETAASYEDCPANHAEINALLMTDRSQREGGTIFVTGSICLTCAKAIGNSGLRNVVIVDGATDGSDSHRQPVRSLMFLEACGIDIQTIDNVEPIENGTIRWDAHVIGCPGCGGPITRDMIERPGMSPFKNHDPGPWRCERECGYRGPFE